MYPVCRKMFFAVCGCISLLVLIFLAGCGGGNSTPPSTVITHFSVTAPATVTAGTAFHVTVSALDASNNVVASYSGTVHFTSSDSQAVLPHDSALTNGMGTFPVILKAVANAIITATDAAAASITGSSSPISVSGNAVTHFSIAAPTTVTTGAAFNVTVSALDASNDVATTYSGAVHFTSTDGKAVLPADSTLPNGTQTFLATLETAGNQTITTTDTVTASLKGTSSSIGVSAAAALSIASTPPKGTVGIEYGGAQRIKFGTTTFTFTFFPLVADLGGAFFCSPFTNASSCSWSWAAAPGSSLPPGLGCCTFHTFLVIWPNPFPRYVSVPDAISGVPTQPGNFNVVLSVSNGAQQTSANFSIVIDPPPPPVINATPAPGIATLNSPYIGFTFTAARGLLPLTWSYSGGLPPGMIISSAGLLSGTPTEGGSFPVTLEVTDSLGRISPRQDFTIQVLSKGFLSTGDMETSRAGHTATLLNNGKVLVAGGSPVGFTPVVATAEFFDPLSGTFSPTGSMGTARVSHTATLLADGRVLVTGGRDTTDNPVSTAEIFDPVKETFSPTGNMETTRLYNTATLLKTGKVLVTGGLDVAGTFLGTAELFDPTTGIFAPTGNMATPRAGHTATTLSDGRVLVAGGDTATAEIFDPATGSFTPTGSLEAARVNHAATLLKSGKVLVTGGQDSSGTLASAELFDPALGTFTPTGSMETVRTNHTAVLLADGTVLVAGGNDNSTGLSFSSAELFDPASGSFAPTADMTATRASHTATMLPNGQVLVTGGQGGAPGSNSTLATAELYQ